MIGFGSLAYVAAASNRPCSKIGDGAAAVVGRRYGRTRYPFSPKSVEGSAAFFVTAFLAAIPFGLVGVEPLGLGTLAVGAFTAAVVEALPVDINDNLRVPLVAGAAMLLAQSLG